MILFAAIISIIIIVVYILTNILLAVDTVKRKKSQGLDVDTIATAAVYIVGAVFLIVLIIAVLCNEPK